MLEGAPDAAAIAGGRACGVMVAHTPDWGGVSRWRGGYPPTVLHYHGARSEAASGVPSHVFQQEGRLLALPFVARVIAGSSEATRELATQDATILPLGADRLGIWSSQFMPLRESVRHDRD